MQFLWALQSLALGWICWEDWQLTCFPVVNNLSHCSMTGFPVDSNGCFSQAIPFAFLLWHRDNTNLNVPDQQIDPRQKRKKERKSYSLIGNNSWSIWPLLYKLPTFLTFTTCQTFVHISKAKFFYTEENKIYAKTQLQCVGYHSTYGCLKSLRKQVCELKKHLRWTMKT